MLTNNYYAILTNSYSKTDDKVQLTTINGDKISYTGDEWSELNFGSASRENGLIRFGTGTTPPTRDDYKLSGEGFLGNVLTQQSMVGSYELLGDGVKTTKILFIKNTGTEPVTIGEVCWRLQQVNSATDGGAHAFLQLDRTLLEEPVTIPVGSTAQINYSIFFKYGS